MIGSVTLQANDVIAPLIAMCQAGPGPGTLASQVVTLTLGSPGTVNLPGHGLAPGQSIVFATTGALPTGLTAGVTYFVLGPAMTANTFQVSASSGGAALNFTVSQSGIQSINPIQSTNFAMKFALGELASALQVMANALATQSAAL